MSPVSGTRLINIEYLSTRSADGGRGGEQTGEDLTDYNFQTRHNATREASAWLGNQLNELRKQSEDLQAKVVDPAARLRSICLWPNRQPGPRAGFTPALDQLQQSTSQLEQAQAARIMKGALYQVVKDGDPELISGLAGNGMLSGASASVTGSLRCCRACAARKRKHRLN